MIGGTRNSIEGGDGNAQIGHNAGIVVIGLTFEQHQAALDKAIAAKEADLERAHVAEKRLIQAELDQLRQRHDNIHADYQAKLVELAETKALLARYDNQIERARYDEAMVALDRGETALAETILLDLTRRAALRREDAAAEEAKLHVKLGEIAEGRVDWRAAAGHYETAARLNPTYDTLIKAGELLWRAGNYEQALAAEEELLRIAGRDFGPRDERTATAMNNLAETLRALGRFPQAEPLYRKALEIWRENLGDRHADVATRLNNLAGLLQATGRLAEAEPLYREALKISREALGDRHPDVAGSLNNLAMLLKYTGRFSQAEPLNREALEISREKLGDRHPAVATRLNNLAVLLFETGRGADAVPLALESVDIMVAALPAGHPHTRIAAKTALVALRAHAPDHRRLPEIAALAGE